jgi:hypothetical protein
MNTTLKMLMAAVIAVAAGCTGVDDDAGGGAAAAAAGAPGGDGGSTWVTLFDGTSLDGWNAVGDANWSIADGAVRADDGNGHLVSSASYRDFDLELEFWVSDDANSGVFIRCTDSERINPETCYEVNIFDQRPDPTYRTGSIVDLAPPMENVDTGGQWNRYRISAVGSRLLVTLNGIDTVDIDDERLAEGPFTLQYGTGTVMFRNVRIRPL